MWYFYYLNKNVMVSYSFSPFYYCSPFFSFSSFLDGMEDATRPIYYEFDDYDYFGDFITSRYVKGYWAAFYVLCLYWGFFWFCRHIFGDGNNNMFHREEAVHNLESDRIRSSRRHLTWTNSTTAIDIFVNIRTTV